MPPSAAPAEDHLESILLHAARIDPSTPDGTRQVRYLLEHLPRSSADRGSVEGLFARAGRESPEPDVADRALVAAAAFALSRSAPEAAYKRLREVLSRRHETSTPIEVAALVNLARLLGRDDRNYEALVVAGRAKRLALALNIAEGAAHAALERGASLRNLGEFAAAREELDQAAELTGSPTLRNQIEVSRLDVLHAEERYDDALAGLDRLFDAAGSAPAGLDPHWAGAFRTHLLLDAGRANEADAALRPHLEHMRDPPYRALRALSLLARIRADQGDAQRARSAAEEALALADSLAETPGTHRFWVVHLAAVFTALDDDEGVARCADVQAREMLSHIVAIDRVAHDLPAVVEIHADDRGFLVRGRERFLVEHARALNTLTERIARAESGPAVASLFPADGDANLVRVCAWCARLQSAEGQWLPVAHLITPRGPFRVTHGMCPGCLAAFARHD